MKKDIKNSEARILVYLKNVHVSRAYVTSIAAKLDLDYSYAMRILQAMVGKGWLRKQKSRRFMFYMLTAQAPLELALNSFNSDILQRSLESYKTPEEDIPDVMDSGFSAEKTAELNRDIEEERKKLYFEGGPDAEV